MDITLHNLDKFPSYADVSITHPCLKGYLDGAAVKAGSAASAREKVKRDRYLPFIAKNVHFFPLVMETYGSMGKEFRRFTQKIESAFKRNRGKENLAAFKTAFKYDLSCVLQHGNAQLLQQGLIRVHRQQHIRNDKLFRPICTGKRSLETKPYRKSRVITSVRFGEKRDLLVQIIAHVSGMVLCVSTKKTI
jgi:hypothetical protein